MKRFALFLFVVAVLSAVAAGCGRPSAALAGSIDPATGVRMCSLGPKFCPCPKVVTRTRLLGDAGQATARALGTAFRATVTTLHRFATEAR